MIERLCLRAWNVKYGRVSKRQLLGGAFLLMVLLQALWVDRVVIAQEDEDLLAPPAIPGTAVYIPFPVNITLDGDLSEWASVPHMTVVDGPQVSPNPAENGSFTFAVAADEERLYVAMTMPDQNIVTGQHGSDYWNEDSLEFYLNLTDDLDARHYADGIYQIRIAPAGIGSGDPVPLSSTTGINLSLTTVSGFVFDTPDGWGFEAAVPLSDFLTPKHGLEIGFHAKANGATGRDRDVNLLWSKADPMDNSWQDPSLFGKGVFFEVDRKDVPMPSERNELNLGDAQSAIRVNQVGYYPSAEKRAVLVLDSRRPTAWVLWDEEGYVQLTGTSLPFGYDQSSGEFVHHIDFSEFTQQGADYSLGVADMISLPFDISWSIYTDLKKEALAFFYRSRSGIDLESEYAGEAWARPAGHLSDDSVTCYQGADADGNHWPGCDYTLDVSGGWYDAGDYGKYVVNGGVSVWTLLNLYEWHPDVFGDDSLDIPERNNGVPDILDEARWELEFMLGMQIPAGHERAGMVHHKIHDLHWAGASVLPATHYDNDNAHQDEQSGRYLYPATTAATLNLAATAAQCARVWDTIDPDFGDRCLTAAELAWQAALEHPEVYAGRVPGDGGGDYLDDNVGDEFYWAATELYITTGKDTYRDFVVDSPHFRNVPDGTSAIAWHNTAALGTISLASVPNDLAGRDVTIARNSVVAAADQYLDRIGDTAYLMPVQQFYWGSNVDVLNNALVMGWAYEFTGEGEYLNGMMESMNYLLGRNPLAQSYISGFGERSAQHPHHRFWVNMTDNDGLFFPPPPPGAIVAGPNEDANDAIFLDVDLTELPPAKRYIDHQGSWSTNEVSINANAPLAWVTAFIDECGRTAQPSEVDRQTPLTVILIGLAVVVGGGGIIIAWRRRMLPDVLFLSLLGLYVFLGRDLTPFHGDESTFIRMSRDYDYIFHEHDVERLRYKENPDAPEEQYERVLIGAITPLSIGLARNFNVPHGELNGFWRWDRPSNMDPDLDMWEWNVQQGNMPGDQLQRIARTPSTVFTILSGVALFAVAWRWWHSRLVAWIAVLVYITTPAVLVDGRRAMQEGAVFFFSATVIYLAICAIQELKRQARWRWLMLWYFLLGVASGLAVASKHTAIFPVVVAYLALMLTALLLPKEPATNDDDAPSPVRRFLPIVASGLLSLATFFTFMPVWWTWWPIIVLLLLLAVFSFSFSVIGVARRIWIFRSGVLLALIGMTAVMPTAWLALPEVARITIETRRSLTSNLVLKQQDPIDGPVEHVLVLLEKLFFSETEYYQDPDWSTFEAVNAQVAACKASTLCGRQNNVLWGVSLSILSALGLWGMIARWRGSETLLLLLWLMVPILILGTINALPWQRYYNVLYAQLGLLVGVGVRQAWRLIASQIPRTTLTAAELE